MGTKFAASFLKSAIVFITILPQLICGELDTLSNYYSGSSVVYYRKAVTQAGRFDIPMPCYINYIKVKLGGESANGEATLHVYGQEGGLPFPYLEKDLVKPVLIKKSKPGIDTVLIQFEDGVYINGDQFFIVIDSISPGILLVSDQEARAPSCSSETGGNFFGQCLKGKDGIWTYGKYGYGIDVGIEYVEKSANSYFKDLTQDTKINDTLSSNRSISATDIDGDAYIDLLFDGRLYLNNRDNTFEDITVKSGISGKPKANIFIDINCDGHIDILFLHLKDSLFKKQNLLYLNDGDGNFIKRDLILPIVEEPKGFSLSDINNDAFPDIFISQGDSVPLPNLLLLNDQRNGFFDISKALYTDDSCSKISEGVSFIDYDNDGDQDLFVVNHELQDELWENKGDLKFENIINKVFLKEMNPNTNLNKQSYGYGCDWADFDMDGDIDLLLPESIIITNPKAENEISNSIYRQDKNERAILFNQSVYEGVEYEEALTGGTFGDVNNDGLLDIILTTGCECRYADLYLQEKNESFRDVAFQSGFNKRSLGKDALFTDINNDGNIDLITTENNFLKVYLNTGDFSKGNYVGLDLSSYSKDNIIGSRIDVYVEGQKYSQELSSGRGLLIQEPLVLHYGLGSIDEVDSVKIYRPNGEKKGDKFTDIDINEINKLENKKVDEEKTVSAINYSAAPNPFKSETKISFDIPNSGKIKIDILSLNGSLVKRLVSSDFNKGYHNISWDGSDQNNVKAASGAYIYKINFNNREFLGKIVLVD